MMEQKGAGLVQPGEEMVKRVLSCCHPVHCPTGLHGRERHRLLLKSTGKRQEKIGTGCNRENSCWTYEKNLFL